MFGTTLKKLVTFVSIFCLFIALSMTAAADDPPCGLVKNDPMVKICSQAIDKDIDVVLAGISEDVSESTGIDQKFITYYWSTLDSVNCMGEKTTEYPILVDLYVPGFFSDEDIAGFMESLATALQTNVGIDPQWVFIYVHVQKPGQVFISGEVLYGDGSPDKDDSSEEDKD
jgi:hypothetical protein